MLLLAYSYIRFSTARQADGESLNRQTRGTNEWCTANGYQLVRAYEDLGVSARKGKNSTEGALADFIAAVRSGKVPVGSALVVEQLDRLSRDAVRRAVRLFLEIMDLGIDVVTVGDGRVYRHDKCELIDVISAVVFLSAAHATNEHRIQRVQDAMDARRNRTLAGEIIPGRCPGWLRWDGTAFVAIPAKAAVVQRAYSEFLAGRSLEATCADLNSEGVYTMRGEEKRKHRSRWTTEILRHLLRSHAVVGRYTPGASVGRPGETLNDYYPSIIPVDDWSTVQTVLDKRRTTRVRDRNAVPNILVGLCRCHVCGHAMQRFNANKRQACLKCFEPGCRRSGIDHVSLELAVMALLRDQITDQDIKCGSGEGEAIRRRMVEVERERGELEHQIDHTIQVSALGGLSPERTATAVKRLEERITALTSEEETARGSLHRLDTSGVRQEVDRLRVLLASYQGEDHDARRRISHSLRQIVDHVLVNTDTQQAVVQLRGSGVKHVLTPLSERFRYIVDATPLVAIQVHVPDEGEVEHADTELLGGNILVDRFPIDARAENIYRRPRVERLDEARVLVHPRELSVGNMAMLSLTEAATEAAVGRDRLMQLCRSGSVPGAYQGVDGRWSIPRDALQHVMRKRRPK